MDIGISFQIFFSGNSRIHNITGNSQHELRIDMEDFDGVSKYATYSSFSVDDEERQFRLTVLGYNGDAGRLIRFYKNFRYF